MWQIVGRSLEGKLQVQGRLVVGQGRSITDRWQVYGRSVNSQRQKVAGLTYQVAGWQLGGRLLAVTGPFDHTSESHERQFRSLESLNDLC